MNVNVRVPHRATFRGKHNASKSKVLLVLDGRKGVHGGLDARALHLLNGVSLKYLWFRLPKWVEWRYLIRRRGHGMRGHVWYRIAKRGLRFVNERIPPGKKLQYLREIELFQAGQAKRKRVYLKV